MTDLGIKGPRCNRCNRCKRCNLRICNAFSNKQRAYSRLPPSVSFEL